MDIGTLESKNNLRKHMKITLSSTNNDEQGAHKNKNQYVVVLLSYHSVAKSYVPKRKDVHVLMLTSKKAFCFRTDWSMVSYQPRMVTRGGG